MVVKPVDRDEPNTGGVAANWLWSFVERIERLEKDWKAARRFLHIRKQEAADMEELEARLNVCRHALRM